MAVENKYVNANVAAGTQTEAVFNVGVKPLVLIQTFEVLAADDDDSIYRIFKGVSGDLIPVDISIMCDGITSGTDWDLGLYETDLGDVIDADVFADGITLATAKTRKTALDGLITLGIEDANKRIYELAGHTMTTRKSSYDIALTANTVGSATGTVTVVATFARA